MPNSGAKSMGSGPPADVVALAQLWADQFQHMTTLAVAGSGGLLLMLEAGLVTARPGWWAAFLLFAIAALLGIIGQANVVDEATAGLPPGRSPRVLRNMVFLSFGSGAYWLIRLFI
jgi:hypothetical protein